MTAGEVVQLPHRLEAGPLRLAVALIQDDGAQVSLGHGIQAGQVEMIVGPGQFGERALYCDG